MKKIILVIVLSVLFLFSCFSNTEIEGVWTPIEYPNSNKLKEKEFSWGISETIEYAIEIDLHEDQPKIKIDMFGTHLIKNIETTNDIIEITFLFRQSQELLTMKIHMIDENKMWIEPIENYSIFGSGPEFIYYKLSGPK